jgi:PadR family transcriptional regulator PadR
MARHCAIGRPKRTRPALTDRDGKFCLTRRNSHPYYRISTIVFLSSSRLKKHSNKSGHRELYSGFIRLHVLYHASQEPIFGLEMIEELARHGYRLSPGTMYPLLHGLEKKGLLRSTRTGPRPNSRLVYRATTAGHAALAVAKDKVRELFGELFEDAMNTSSKWSKRS